MNIEKEVIARFWSKVTVLKKNQCWVWNSSISPNGYGKISINNRPESAQKLTDRMFCDERNVKILNETKLLWAVWNG